MTKDEAIDWASGKSPGKAIDLAAKLGITHGAISHWDKIPIKQQYRIARMSKGRLKVDDDELEFVEARK